MSSRETIDQLAGDSAKAPHDVPKKLISAAHCAALHCARALAADMTGPVKRATRPALAQQLENLLGRPGLADTLEDLLHAVCVRIWVAICHRIHRECNVVAQIKRASRRSFDADARGNAGDDYLRHATLEHLFVRIAMGPRNNEGAGGFEEFLVDNTGVNVLGSDQHIVLVANTLSLQLEGDAVPNVVANVFLIDQDLVD